MKEFNWRFAFLIGFTAVIGNTLWPVFNTYVPIFLQSGHPLWEGAGDASRAQVTGFALSPMLAYFIMTYQAGVGSFGVFELHLTAGRVSQLVGMAAILYIVLVVPGGLLATRFGPRRVMLTGMLLYVASNILIALFAQSEPLFFILLLLYGTAF